MGKADVIGKVEVLYALPAEQAVVDLGFKAGMTAGEAVRLSGLPDRYPEITRSGLVLGIWGVRVAPDRVLRPGDRVEISRPLPADPRDMRRDMMQSGRVMGGAPAPDGKNLRKPGRG